ncbi:DUF3853 family protein [Bacteroides neonati]|uniref:DUF3853 family protein n=1 Tax=Bacteroides neonati TaxID=1347393 RepID=UPI0004AD3ACC|nr:DUF3853 family protein [Bacteroides neonati]
MKDLDLKKKLLIQSTLGDFVELMKKEFGFTNETSDNGEEVKPAPLSKKRYVYGITGITELFGCSTATAQRIKSSGAIDAAISQNGKIIVVDADLALDLLRVSNQKWSCKYSK